MRVVGSTLGRDIPKTGAGSKGKLAKVIPNAERCLLSSCPFLSS